MDVGELKFIMQELQFANRMPNEVIEQLAQHATLQCVPAGKPIFREGMRDPTLYLVRSGRVALEMNVPRRGSVRILTVGPGQMIGWSALLDDDRMTASAIAVDDTELVAALARDLRMLSELNHEFGYHLFHQMAYALANRLVATRLQLLDLFAEDPTPIPVNDEGTA